MKNVAKMLMRHESEMRLLRQDTTWMMFCGHGRGGHPSASSAEVRPVAADVSAEAGDHQPAGSPSHLCLPGTGYTHSEPHDGFKTRWSRMQSVGWLVEGETALNPKWVYQQWSPEKQTVELSKQPPISFTLAQEAIQAVINNVGGQGVLLRFRSTRPMTEQISSEVLPFAMVLSLSGEPGDASSSGIAFVDGQCLLESGGDSHPPGSGTAVQVGQGTGELVCRPVVCRLAASQTGLDTIRPAGREVTREPGGGEEVSLTRPVRVIVRPRMQAPQGCLQNPHNLC